jgi:hypothetical protein
MEVTITAPEKAAKHRLKIKCSIPQAFKHKETLKGRFFRHPGIFFYSWASPCTIIAA